jgi:hypothetical protein
MSLYVMYRQNLAEQYSLFVHSTKCYPPVQIKEHEMCGTCGIIGREEKFLQDSLWKSE